MSGGTVSTSLGYGVAGGISRIGPNQPVIENRLVATTSANVTFGLAVSCNTSDAIVAAATTALTTSNLFGVAVANVQTYLTFPIGQNTAQVAYYAPGQACDVIKLGIITVYIQRGTSINARGQVYIRSVYNGTYASAVVGGFETGADSSNTIAPTNWVWNTNSIDGNGMAEIEILYATL
jgi:hypothetical protein